MARDGREITYPDAPAYLVGWLESAGWFVADAMGMQPLPAQELMAWSAGSGHRLTPWEFRVMSAASQAFVSEYRADNPAPPDQQAKPEKPRLIGAFKNLAKEINKK